MRIIIAGGRDFKDYDLLHRSVFFYTQNISEKPTIISGGARGADYLGEKFARQNDLDVEVFKADWKGLGKSAGIVRNRQMGDGADCLIAFHDGKSRGTKQMIDYMKGLGKPTKVVLYK